jgi:hypothetical protein
MTVDIMHRTVVIFTLHKKWFPDIAKCKVEAMMYAINYPMAPFHCGIRNSAISQD